MHRTIHITVIAALSAAVATTISIQQHQLHSERVRSVAYALAAVNAAAERDSTRSIATMNRKVAALLGDSLRLVEKHVLQVTQRRDALDEALGRERRAAYIMNAAVDSLRRTTTAPVMVSADSDVRRASFDLRQAPYTVAAQVEIPQPPDSARLAIQVLLDTIKIGARLTCSTPDDHGIRAATIVASTPAWAAVSFGSVQQSPDVCMPPGARREQPHRLAFKPLSIGLGRAALWGGSSGWALFVGGVVIWT
jgi:hypothetical protein